MRRLCPAFVVILAAALGYAAPAGVTVLSEPGLTVTARVDWVNASVAVEIARVLDPAIVSAARAKGVAETDIETRLPELLSRAIAPVLVDSSRTFDDILGADPALYARVSALAVQAKRTEIFLSADFSTLVARYAVPFFGPGGVGSPLFPSRATPVRRRLGDVTTRTYTGLVIDARGLRPEAGTARDAAARPALFPRIWDEQMNLVLDLGMCTPESLARWGMVGYASTMDDAALLRAGALPLLVAARAVFGANATDLVISDDAARQLLALAENIALLQQGRIVIVYGNLN